MTDAHSRASTRNSKFIKAPQEALYRAFTDPAALAVWLAPGDMTGEVHSFDDRVEVIRCRCIILHPNKPSAARLQKGKIDILHGLWNSRHLEESSKR